MKIAFVDTETTGLEDSDELIDVCVCVWDNGTQAPWFRRRFLPVGPVHPRAAAVNGYDPSTWATTEYAPGKVPGYFTAADAEEIAAVLSLGDMLGGAATHFDVRMLKAAFARVRAPWPKSISHRLVDVHSLANPLLLAGKIKSVSLGELVAFFGLGVVPHTAPGDVSLTMQVYERLLGMYWPAVSAPVAPGAGVP